MASGVLCLSLAWTGALGPVSAPRYVAPRARDVLEVALGGTLTCTRTVHWVVTWTAGGTTHEDTEQHDRVVYTFVEGRVTAATASFSDQFSRQDLDPGHEHDYARTEVGAVSGLPLIGESDAYPLSPDRALLDRYDYSVEPDPVVIPTTLTYHVKDINHGRVDEDQTTSRPSSRDYPDPSTPRDAAGTVPQGTDVFDGARSTPVMMAGTVVGQETCRWHLRIVAWITPEPPAWATAAAGNGHPAGPALSVTPGASTRTPTPTPPGATTRTLTPTPPGAAARTPTATPLRGGASVTAGPPVPPSSASPTTVPLPARPASPTTPPSAATTTTPSTTPALRVWQFTWANGHPVQLDQTNPPTTIDQVTARCGDAPGAYWVACGGATRTNKNWPVVFVRGERPEIRGIKFVRKGRPFAIVDGTMIGVSLVGGSSLPFQWAHIHEPKGFTNLALGAAQADATLPNEVMNLTNGRMVALQWTLLDPTNPDEHARRIDAGTTRLPIYVNFAAPIGPPGPLSLPRQSSRLGAEHYYLSFIHPGTYAAIGVWWRQAVIDTIWALYTHPKRDGLYSYRLDPATGQVSQSKRLQFWPSGWSLLKELSGQYPSPVCTDVLGLLRKGVGTCSRFAEHLALLWLSQGIYAELLGLNPLPLPPGFVVMPDAQFFLVGSWTFGQLAHPGARCFGRPLPADPRFPYVVGFAYRGSAHGTPRVCPGTKDGHPLAVDFSGATGQWNTHPPGYWSTHQQDFPWPGDHALTLLPDPTDPRRYAIYDPSYGRGPFGAPFSGVSPGWEEAAIVGWARLLDENGKPVDEPSCTQWQHPFCYLLVHRGERW